MLRFGIFTEHLSRAFHRATRAAKSGAPRGLAAKRLRIQPISSASPGDTLRVACSAPPEQPRKVPTGRASAMLQLARERPGVVAGRAASRPWKRTTRGAPAAPDRVDVDEVAVRSVPALRFHGSSNGRTRPRTGFAGARPVATRRSVGDARPQCRISATTRRDARFRRSGGPVMQDHSPAFAGTQ